MFHPYSHSKLTTFETCPKMFKYRYIDKIKIDQRPEYFERGSNIHSELERYPETQSEILKEFFNSEVGRKYDLILRNDPKREVRIGFDSDFKLTTYKNTNVLNGIIDMIYMQDSTVHLVDWKTGQVPKDQNWSQLETYAAAFLDRYQVQVSYVYIDGKTERSKLYTQDQRADIIDGIKTQIKNIESCTEFNRRITWKCDYCQFKDICKPHDHGIESESVSIL